jgi:hypothetical protein
MSFLIPEEEIRALQEKYGRERPTPAQILIRAVQEDSEIANLSIEEMAAAAGRSQTWVRNTLRTAGIALPRAKRSKKVQVRASTLCAACGHPFGGARARAFKLPAHCTGNVQHGHWSNPQRYTCSSTHCLVAGCECQKFRP